MYWEYIPERNIWTQKKRFNRKLENLHVLGFIIWQMDKIHTDDPCGKEGDHG